MTLGLHPQTLLLTVPGDTYLKHTLAPEAGFTL